MIQFINRTVEKVGFKSHYKNLDKKRCEKLLNTKLTS